MQTGALHRKDTDLGVSGIDHVTFEVLRNLFEYTCDRMSTVLQRASFSPILSDMVDFSNAIYDADMRLLSQAANVPVHLAAMKFSAHAVRDEFGIESMKDGDIYVVNDPYCGGTHINDISWIKPVFYKGRELLGFAVSRGHWMDFGGGAPGGQSWGTHIAEEGLRLPPIRAFQNNEIDPTLMKILLANTRTPHFIRGDLQAHVGCLKAAEGELQSAADRYGIDTVRTAMRELIAYTERIVRQKIEEIPDGVYEGEDYADCDGQQEGIVKVKVKMTVSGSNITVDLSDSDPQCLGAINSPIANTMSAVYYSLQFFLDPTAPQNEGMFEPI
ncbi:MAG: hydantoinase B/oxoprolinase family protein, partial [Gammaproteobacteria bacterium]|nr:hydantoinase B/oxoprolinase family protein [Gammaproteobacteria bacterium]